FVYAYSGLVSLETLDLVSRLNLSFAQNRKIESSTLRIQQPFDDVGPAKLNSELVTGQAWRRGHHFCRADAKSVADIDLGFEQPFDRKILTERSRRQFHAGKFPSPIFVMFVWISVHGFVHATMDR